MINLKSLFKNHFSDKEISNDELRKFAEDNLMRLTANNPSSAFTTIISATGIKYTAYFGALSNTDVAEAVRQALTVTVDNKLKAFKEKVSRKEADIRSAFGKDGAEYQEFFPHGMTEYSNATKENVEVLMERLVVSSNKYAAQLPDDFPDMWSATHDEYQTARATQLGKKGMVADNADTRDAARTALELQLVANLHFIGFTYPGDVEQCMAYFDQSFILNKKPVEDGEHEPVG